MKILEICPFSAGICGVWGRVKQESLELSKKGHEVVIFSSNMTKGSDEIAPGDDRIRNIKIRRFESIQPGKGYLKFIPGGESYIFWDFLKAKKEALSFNPEVVICHNYRHPHTKLALSVSKKIKAKSFLVTHAPFVEGNLTRSFFSKISVWFYDKFIGPHVLSKFTKIISITKWEKTYLNKLGVSDEKIVYIPNGIPNEFFDGKIKNFFGKKILFLGRIAPIKNLEILFSTFKKLKDKKLSLEIVGPIEQGYDEIRKFSGDGAVFTDAIYDISEKIKKINEADIFILPSKREAMPQSLIEAMALGKLVIASKTSGAKEIINDGENGLLFEIGSENELCEKINWVIDKKNLKKIGKIRVQARKKSEKFKWGDLVNSLEKLINVSL